MISFDRTIWMGLWREVGEPIPHMTSTMVLASSNKSMVVTASSFQGVQAFEFQDLAWQALDLKSLNGFFSSDEFSGVSISSDGKHILVTVSTPSPFQNATGTNFARLFSRTGDTFFFLDEFQIFSEGEVRFVKLAESGDMIIVMPDEIVVYDRKGCVAK